MLAAFPKFPRVVVPAATATKGPRLFELRTYESPGEKAHLAKVRMFSELGEIEIFKRVGLTPVFFSRTVAGPRMPNLVYMLVYDNMAGREKAGMPSVPIRSGRRSRRRRASAMRRSCPTSRPSICAPRRARKSEGLLTSAPAPPSPDSVHARDARAGSRRAGGVAGTAARPAGVHRHLHRGEGPGSKGIYAFRFDDKTGALTPLGAKAETRNPSFLAAAASGKVLYAVNEVGRDYNGEKAGSVTSFAVDPASGALKLLGAESTGGGAPCHVQCDATGRFVAVANYSGGNFALFPVRPDGRLGPSTALLGGTGSGPNKTRQQGPHAHQVSPNRATSSCSRPTSGSTRFSSTASTRRPAG